MIMLKKKSITLTLEVMAKKMKTFLLSKKSKTRILIAEICKMYLIIRKLS